MTPNSENATPAHSPRPAVCYRLNGEKIFAMPGESILESARRYGTDIPHLCHKPGYRPDGNCRACVVEIEGERVLAPSCCRAPKPDMRVQTRSPRALHSQKIVLELLQSDMPDQARRNDSELAKWAEILKVPRPRFHSRAQPEADLSHPAIAVNLDACIQCGRCARACREEQGNDIIGYAGRGAGAAIVFDLADRMGESACVACGECVQACPTGALAHANGALTQAADKKVDSLCPYCGVGCQTVFHVKDNQIIQVDGRDGPANHGRLCVKGRYGLDYSRHPHRLTRPLVRRDDAPKIPTAQLDPDDWEKVFRPAEWDEALDLAAGRLREIRDSQGGQALAGFGSAKGSNEEAYLFQKLVRTGFRVNNVDHCTRLCHASSVAALLEGVGSGAVSNQVSDVMKADVALVIGANPTVNHPVAATWMKNAARRGTKLIVADPRESALARHAEMFLQIRPDSDVALLNGMMHVIVKEGLADDDFIRARTREYAALKAQVEKCPPEAMSAICGIAPEEIRRAARLYAKAGGAMIFWGMGISQHTHGTDNARCLIALALATGNVGRPGCGLHPLRGQNNVQGASDAGLIPMVYPDYRRVDDPAARDFYAKFWDYAPDENPGLTVVEIIHAALEGKIRGMYVMGENPAMSDPDATRAREGLAALEWLVVQDIFLTETAALADVVLPASAFPEKTGTFTNTDRMVQLGRRALDPPGEARPDLEIIQQMAKRLGLAWDYPGEESGVARVFEEMRKAMPSVAGITWERLRAEHSVTYPCEREGDAGEGVIFRGAFPTADGLGRFVPAAFTPADELPDADYPLALITGRELEHWHTGAMTRRARVLDALEPSPGVYAHPEDLVAMGIAAGEMATVSSRRGKISLAARADWGSPRGVLFVPFCYYEAAANLLTNPKLDPWGKIPEFKYCAVRLERGGEQSPPLSFGAGAGEAQAAAAE